MMRHQVVWVACAVTDPKTGEEKILNRGDMLPAWVSEFTRSVLTGAGAVKVVEGDQPAPDAAAAAPAEQQPAAPAVPPIRPPAAPSPPPPEVSAKSTKPELVEYGVAKGGDRAELEKLTVKELQARFLQQQ